MAAIDLLLNWNPTSERMHQVVLAGLLRHTQLLQKLNIAPAAVIDLQVETYNRLYDFTVKLATGTKVHIELKVDASLDKERQIKRQIQSLPEGDLLLYILLGITRFQWNARALGEVRLELENAPPFESIRWIDLPQMQKAVNALAADAVDPDHRDLAVAYGALLRQIEALTTEFERKQLAKWEANDWQGFYAKLNERLGLTGGQGYLPTPAGGFVALWWHGLPLPLGTDTEAYLQLEQEKLCFKVSVPKEVERGDVRNSFFERIKVAAQEQGFLIRRPARFWKGHWMTVAIAEGEYRSRNDTLDWDFCQQTIRRAESVLEAAVCDVSERSVL